MRATRRVSGSKLAKRDRSLVTISALIAMNRPDQLRSHLARARDNGVTEEEAIETITHLAFYAGWPNAVTAVAVAREVFQKSDGQASEVAPGRRVRRECRVPVIVVSKPEADSKVRLCGSVLNYRRRVRGKQR